MRPSKSGLVNKHIVKTNKVSQSGLMNKTYRETYRVQSKSLSALVSYRKHIVSRHSKMFRNVGKPEEYHDDTGTGYSETCTRPSPVICDL